MSEKPDSSPKKTLSLQVAPRGSPCYQEISELIAGRDAPSWLPRFLSDWAISLALDRNVQAVELKRAEMRKILAEIGGATIVIRRRLGDPQVKNFLEDDPLGAITYRGALDHLLADLASRAAQAGNSPQLVDAKGRTKAGQGGAASSRAISPMNYCALLIAVIWRQFNAGTLTVRNLKAARAAEMLWSATGKERQGWGNDPLTAWRHHFKAARTLKGAENLSAEIERHLTEHARQWKLHCPPDDQNRGD